jgi:large subunit ribosomal protein L30
VSATTGTKLHVRQVHSGIGEPEGMRITLRGLGLKGPATEVTVANTPSFRGAIKKVMHLVSVTEVAASASAPAASASKKKAS